jgi:hypothetical protein
MRCSLPEPYLSTFVAAAGGLGTNDRVWLLSNPLGSNAVSVQIPVLTNTYGVKVYR